MKKNLLAEIKELGRKLAVDFEEYKHEHPGTKKTKSDEMFQQKAHAAHTFSSEASRYNKQYGMHHDNRDPREHKYVAGVYRDHAKRVEKDPKHVNRSHPEDSTHSILNELADWHENAAKPRSKRQNMDNPYLGFTDADHTGHSYKDKFHEHLLK